MLEDGVVKYIADDCEIKLSIPIVRKYLVSGDASKVTDKEIVAFIQLCRYQKLNPYLREAYLIKYENEATLVVGKDLFTKRAARNPVCGGWEAGVIVRKGDGSIESRRGCLVLDGEELRGGWAKVHRKGWETPLEISVNLHEYIRYNRNGNVQKNWKTMSPTMIRKVALVQALREAFPEDFKGLYSIEEMPIPEDVDLPENPVSVSGCVQKLKSSGLSGEKATNQSAGQSSAAATSQPSAAPNQEADIASDGVQVVEGAAVVQEAVVVIGKMDNSEICNGYLFRTAMESGKVILIGMPQERSGQFAKIPGGRKCRVINLRPVEVVLRSEVLSKHKEAAKFVVEDVQLVGQAQTPPAPPKPAEKPAEVEVESGKPELTNAVLKLGQRVNSEKVAGYLFRTALLQKGNGKVALIGVPEASSDEFASLEGGKNYIAQKLVPIKLNVGFSGPLAAYRKEHEKYLLAEGAIELDKLDKTVRAS